VTANDHSGGSAAAEPQGHLPGQTDVAEMDAHEKKTLHQAIAGSALGNAVEWFDYAVYGYLAVYMAQVFFGSESGDAGLGIVLTFATLALSFIIRPLGGIVLGPLGDRIGRQKVLVLTITVMTLATAAIGILPTFESVGILAPILLLLCRLVQGFSTGGEYGGAAVFMAEYAPDRRRGFFGAFLEFGTLAGTSAGAVLCTVLILLVGDDGMLAGWWRLPFLLTLPLGLVALWLRVRLQEPPVFTEAEQHHETSKRPLRDLVRSYWRQILVLMGFVVLLNVAYYLILAYMPTYLSANLGLSTAQGNLMLVGIMLAMMCFINPLGALSDRIGRKPLLITAAVGYMVLSVPAFLLINANSLVLQILGLAILGLFLVILIGSVSSTLPALFPTKVRYSGFAIGYNISTAIFGGTAAAVNAALIESTGSTLVPGWYLAAAGAIGLVAILCMRETARCSLRGNHIPGTDAAENAAIKAEKAADKEAARA
jgi:MFS transporter, MHS family, proline/betaine transporter